MTAPVACAISNGPEQEIVAISCCGGSCGHAAQVRPVSYADSSTPTSGSNTTLNVQRGRLEQARSGHEWGHETILD